MKHDIEAILDLVRECGQLVKDADRRNLHVDAKAGHANFVTDYDKKVQNRLKSGLLKIMPDAHFIGEEGTTQEFSPKGKFFIVDPIDGTTNFIKDFRASSISVALVVDGAAELGARRGGTDYDSASSQFFIVHKTYPSLDGQYAAFGRVTKGIEIVDKICENTKVEDSNGFVLEENRPVITRIYLKDGN